MARFQGRPATLLCLGAPILVFVSALLALPSQADARRVALVIGNSNYSIGQLINPGNDAKAIATTFKSLGFDEVLLQEDLTADGMRNSLRSLAAASLGAEIIAVYFAGHGIELNGKNYLLPVDTKLARAGDIDLEAISLDTVLQQLESATKLKLVILDACRNNPFQPVGGKRSLRRGLIAVEPEDNTLVAYAAKEGTTASDSTGGRHSPFAQALLTHLGTPDLEINFVFRRVRDEVIRATGGEQQPFVYGSLSGAPIYLAAFKPNDNLPLPAPILPPPVPETAQTKKGLEITLQNVDEDSRIATGSPHYGTMVASVEPGGPGDRFGLKVQDIIFAVGKVPVSDSRQFVTALYALESSAIVTLDVWRDGRQETIVIQVPEPPVKAPAFSALGMSIELKPGKGVVVTEVDAGSDAYEKGLKPGDIIKEVAGNEVESLADFAINIGKARDLRRKAVMLYIVRQDNTKRIVPVLLK